jgi:hypothetical protein
MIASRVAAVLQTGQGDVMSKSELKSAAAVLGRKGGLVKSVKKAAAARANGKLGGDNRIKRG